MSILKRVEKGVDDKLRKLFSTPGTQPEVLEVYRGILDEAVSKIQVLARGKRSFPFNHLTVSVKADAHIGSEEMLSDLKQALREKGCEPPRDLDVEVVPSDDVAARGFRIAYENRKREKQVAKMPQATLRLLKGTATNDVVVLEKTRVNVGRLADVFDDQQRMIRRNDIDFTEMDTGVNAGVNATVSRAHAHIKFDAQSGEFRLFDDGSSYGTSVFRDGKLLQAPGIASRGLALRDGDDIYFGQAQMKFELKKAESGAG